MGIKKKTYSHSTLCRIANIRKFPVTKLHCHHRKDVPRCVFMCTQYYKNHFSTHRRSNFFRHYFMCSGKIKFRSPENSPSEAIHHGDYKVVNLLPRVEYFQITCSLCHAHKEMKVLAGKNPSKKYAALQFYYPYHVFLFRGLCKRNSGSFQAWCTNINFVP